jgi:hypothetical protein
MNNDKPFISIKVNGSDLCELNLEDLKKLQDEIQNYIDDIETDEEIFIQGENNNETGEVSDE